MRKIIGILSSSPLLFVTDRVTYHIQELFKAAWSSIHVRLRCNVSIVSERFQLPVTLVKPLVEASFAYRSDIAKTSPSLFIVGEICLLRFLKRVITKHHLVLIKLTIGIHLINDKHITIPTVKVSLVVDEHIKVITVLAELSTDVAVGVIHLLFPFLAVLIHTRAI